LIILTIPHFHFIDYETKAQSNWLKLVVSKEYDLKAYIFLNSFSQVYIDLTVIKEMVLVSKPCSSDSKFSAFPTRARIFQARRFSRAKLRRMKCTGHIQVIACLTERVYGGQTRSR
jgi:hypothetical protein